MSCTEVMEITLLILCPMGMSNFLSLILKRSILCLFLFESFDIIFFCIFHYICFGFLCFLDFLNHFYPNLDFLNF